MRIPTGGAEQRVLEAFLADPSQLQYGMGLMRRARISSGRLYPLLDKLVASRWIVTEMEAIDEAVEGRPPRLLYRITLAGTIQAKRLLEKPPN